MSISRIRHFSITEEQILCKAFAEKFDAFEKSRFKGEEEVVSMLKWGCDCKFGNKLGLFMS